MASDLGNWQVIETPGHAPSHVCLALSGHGRPFTKVIAYLTRLEQAREAHRVPGEPEGSAL